MPPLSPLNCSESFANLLAAAKRTMSRSSDDEDYANYDGPSPPPLPPACPPGSYPPSPAPGPYPYGGPHHYHPHGPPPLPPPHPGGPHFYPPPPLPLPPFGAYHPPPAHHHGYVPYGGDDGSPVEADGAPFPAPGPEDDGAYGNPGYCPTSSTGHRQHYRYPPPPGAPTPAPLPPSPAAPAAAAPAVSPGDRRAARREGSTLDEPPPLDQAGSGSSESSSASTSAGAGPRPAPAKSAFMCFSEARGGGGAGEGGGGKGGGKASVEANAAAWRALSPRERARWEDAAREERRRFDREKDEYRGPIAPKLRAKKDPLAPKRPMSAFLMYAQQVSPPSRVRCAKIQSPASGMDLGLDLGWTPYRIPRPSQRCLLRSIVAVPSGVSCSGTEHKNPRATPHVSEATFVVVSEPFGSKRCAERVLAILWRRLVWRKTRSQHASATAGGRKVLRGATSLWGGVSPSLSPPTLRLFPQKRRPLQRENPDMPNADISRLLGELWRKAPALEKRPFQEREEAERKIYRAKMEAWKSDRKLARSMKSHGGGAFAPGGTGSLGARGADPFAAPRGPGLALATSDPGDPAQYRPTYAEGGAEDVGGLPPHCPYEYDAGGWASARGQLRPFPNPIKYSYPRPPKDDRS
ncbi:hypothetical protein ACHAWF_016827 [Thalassiosira exigua]